MAKQAVKKKSDREPKSVSIQDMNRKRSNEYRSIYSNFADIVCTPYEIRLNFFQVEFPEGKKGLPILEQSVSVSLPIAVAVGFKEAIQTQLEKWEESYREVYESALIKTKPDAD